MQGKQEALKIAALMQRSEARVEGQQRVLELWTKVKNLTDDKLRWMQRMDRLMVEHDKALEESR